jgi:hypothetical protein
MRIDGPSEGVHLPKTVTGSTVSGVTIGGFINDQRRVHS